jgi:hypothetical protein
VSGEYINPTIVLWDEQQAKLRLIIRTDSSAELQITFHGKDDKQLYEGIWIDNGDGLLRVSSEWVNGDHYTLVFSLEPGGLQAREWLRISVKVGGLIKPVESGSPPNNTSEHHTDLGPAQQPNRTIPLFIESDTYTTITPAPED